MSRIAKDRTPVLLAAMPAPSTREACNVIPAQPCVQSRKAPAPESGMANRKTADTPAVKRFVASDKNQHFSA
jgi:hypothetical protein